uniref:uncharacterized protein LOC131125747 n=1 Tax=Doryrhamphus excisus TaxID=161450 RepID=UPI0025ADD5B3|nr:uncharacterized protein LOC131125747 [Doryrhamphus excisus]
MLATVSSIGSLFQCATCTPSRPFKPSKQSEWTDRFHTVKLTADSSVLRRPVSTMDLKFLLTASLVILGAALSISLADKAAQCKIKWLFSIPCDDVYGKLVTQIKAWQVGQHCLDAGETCSYELVSTAPYLINATHTSPKTKTVNELQFLLEQSTVCRVTGDGTSQPSKDPADSHTNFCSLQNLMNGSNLIEAEGYKRFTNKWICPGFEDANCTLS